MAREHRNFARKSFFTTRMARRIIDFHLCFAVFKPSTRLQLSWIQRKTWFFVFNRSFLIGKSHKSFVLGVKSNWESLIEAEEFLNENCRISSFIIYISWDSRRIKLDHCVRRVFSSKCETCYPQTQNAKWENL